MKIAHELGMKTTCTMVFGSQETAESRFGWGAPGIVQTVPVRVCLVVGIIISGAGGCDDTVSTAQDPQSAGSKPAAAQSAQPTTTAAPTDADPTSAQAQ